jgi:hypothetical protein
MNGSRLATGCSAVDAVASSKLTDAQVLIALEKNEHYGTFELGDILKEHDFSRAVEPQEPIRL